MVSRFMNRLGIGRATVIGSSYGGAVAMTLCLDCPEFVEKLVLIDAVCNDEVLNHPILRLASIRGVGEVITPFLVDSRAMMRVQNAWNSFARKSSFDHAGPYLKCPQAADCRRWPSFSPGHVPKLERQ